jgi:UDP-N-acetylglucosamine 2-epimerase (non-hydrolysing)
MNFRSPAENHHVPLRATDLLVVVGARPNFMKAASILPAARAAGMTTTLLHTGQHYDADLSRVFFEELELDQPDVSLGVGSGSHAAQTARVMLEFERELKRIQPRVVVVVGDVNSTVACALVAIKEHYPVAHVEAGLRCYDPWMPEEINRRVTDHLSTHLFTTSPDADENLAREGIPSDRVHFVGNTMIDTLLRFRDAAGDRHAPARFGVEGQPYAVLTLHRPKNVDEPDQLERVLGAALELSRRYPVVFPVHPRTRQRLEGTQLVRRLDAQPSFIQTEPLGYLDFVGLIEASQVVLTDSGGIQEETTVLGIPCLTLRESTERPVTVTHGTNTVVGTDAGLIVEEALKAFAGGGSSTRIPELWDGQAGKRIVDVLARETDTAHAAT